MKKKFLRIICFILVCCTFGLSGCLGGSSGGGSFEGELPDDVKNASGNAEDIINTKDNITYYYNSMAELLLDQGKDANDRNNLKHAFGDAYVFVDPGNEHLFIDHYQGLAESGDLTQDTGYTFPQLVERQVDLLANSLYTSINKIYGDGELDDGDPLTTNDVSKKQLFQLRNQSGEIIDNAKKYTDSVYVLQATKDGESDKDYDNYIYLDDVYTYCALSGLVRDDIYDTHWEIEVDDDPSTDEEETQLIIDENAFLKTQYAILGGCVLESKTFVKDGENKFYLKFANDTTTGTNEEVYKWKIAGDETSLSGVQENLVNNLKMIIASALAGVETPGWTSDDQFYSDILPVLEKIDHLGYTATDKLNLKTRLLDELIGKDALDQDKECLEDLLNFFNAGDNKIINLSQYSDMDDPNKDTIKKIFYDEGASIEPREWQNYKGYEVVIDLIVEEALKATITDEGNGLVGETCYPGFPRMQIIKMDSFDLMDQQVDGVGDSENSDPDSMNPEEFPEAESITFQEKFAKYERILGILLLPKQVYGERTMAIQENGEWVKDEDGNVKLKTFNVEGFILSGADMVMLSEDNKRTLLSADFQVHTATKNMNNSGEKTDVGYVKPDPTEETTYMTIETIDCDKQELIQKEETDVIKDETTLSEYRIQGYNGLDIVDDGETAYIVIGNEGEQDEVRVSLLPEKEENYMVYNRMSTIMHRFITISDINGDEGTTFAGYKINVDTFAGDNFVMVNFPIYGVAVGNSLNHDETIRTANLNILYFYLDCI